MKATLKLFKALPIEAKKEKQPTEELLKKTISMGFVFSPEVIANYTNYDELIKKVEQVIGISGEKANKSFHKSWKKVRDANIEQLVIEQIIHYFTTYGFERLGIYDKDLVYIPNEKLEIPELKDEITLTVIKGYTKEELKTKLMQLLGSGIALKEDTIKDVVDVALFVGINEKDIEKTKNKEVKCILYQYLNLLPENPVEFLRYAIYVATGETLLIKSKDLIEKIKETKNIRVVKLFQDYPKEKLAEIFYRFKPLFLAFRTNRVMKTIINKIRKLAITYHKPMPEDYLNTVTAKVKNNIELNNFEKELDKVNTFRKIRLAYALKFRTKQNIDSILYRIRNGKSYVTDFDFNNKQKARKVLDMVLESITSDISKNVKGKKIYIPDYIHYALPSTEKQFTGDFPSGTYVSIPKDMVFGIYWENVGKNRIDLDLSLIDINGKIGWDASYRRENGAILFSGDITDAPRGATELFYVKRQLENNYIVFLNYFNYEKDIKVPYKIIIAKAQVSSLKKNYMVDPNYIITSTQSEVNKKQNIIGLAKVTTNQNRFYFAETSIGNSITSTNSDIADKSRNYLVNYYQNSISLKDILIKAGAKLVDKKECEIDLSPENIDRQSILKLIGG
jgi:hypothetical protein